MLLLLVEILLVMKLADFNYGRKSWVLGLGSALMIVSGQLVVTGDFVPRWKCLYISIVFFVYNVSELLLGFSFATNAESDPVIRGKFASWKCWYISMFFFMYIVYELLIGCPSATNA